MPKIKFLTVKVDRIDKLYPHKEKCCYFDGHSLIIVPQPKNGVIGGYFDELFPLKKGKQYYITVEEVSNEESNCSKSSRSRKTKTR